MITENLSTLRIHKLTQEQYNRAREAGQLEENAIYLTPDDASNPGGFATEEYVDEKIADLVLESAQADWNQEDESKPDFIHNKPEIPSIEGLATIEYVDSNVSDTYDANSSEAMSGKAVAEALSTVEQVNPDWAQTDDTQPDYIKNKPAIPSVEGFATESYVDEKIREINVQGGVSGPVSWEDIEDKPFGEIVTQTDILPIGRFEEFVFNDTYDTYTQGIDEGCTLTAGEEYKISWDGVEYTCEALDVSQAYNGLPVVAMGNGTAFGFPGNNEPFIIMCNNDIGYVTLVCLYHSEPCEYHDVRVYQETAEIKKIDAEFLPDDIGGDVLPEVSTDDNGKVLGVVDGEWKKIAVGGDGSVAVQANWSQNDESAADYIKNRPFYEYESEEEIVPATRFENFTSDNPYGVYLKAVYEALDLKAGETYHVNWDGSEWTCVAQDASDILPGYVALGNCEPFGVGLSGNSEPFVIASDASISDTIYVALTDTAAGNAHEVRVWQEKMLAKKIDKKFIPIPYFGDTAVTKEFIPAAELVFAYEESDGAYIYTGIPSSEQLQMWQNDWTSATVIWDGTEYVCKSQNVEGAKVFGNVGFLVGGGNNGVPFIALVIPADIEGQDTFAIMSLLDVPSDDSNPDITHNVAITLNTENITTIDSKYIADVSWNKITDRPFGMIAAGTSVFEGSVTTGVNDAGTDDGITVIGMTGKSALKSQYIADGISYSVIIGDITYNGTGAHVGDVIGIDVVNDSGYIVASIASNYGDSYDVFINNTAYFPNGSTYDVKVTLSEDIVQKLNTKYLPNGIGSDLPEVTTSDAGKFLRVSADGTWVAETILNAEEASF